jgi:hypothetical protein
MPGVEAQGLQASGARERDQRWEFIACLVLSSRTIMNHFLYPGFAKLGHNPGRAFLEVFVDACLASRLKGFNSQDLANVINGGNSSHALSYHRGPS